MGNFLNWDDVLDEVPDLQFFLIRHESHINRGFHNCCHIKGFRVMEYWLEFTSFCDNFNTESLILLSPLIGWSLFNITRALLRILFFNRNFTFI